MQMCCGTRTTEVPTEFQDIEEVLQLMVHEEEEGKNLKKEYEHKELNELQSKLMLVAGKAEQGKADVEKFTLVGKLTFRQRPDIYLLVDFSL